MSVYDWAKEEDPFPPGFRHWRIKDHHGVHHAIRLTDHAGRAVCGWPPYGCRMDDRVFSDLDQGEITCPVCLVTKP